MMPVFGLSIRKGDSLDFSASTSEPKPRYIDTDEDERDFDDLREEAEEEDSDDDCFEREDDDTDKT